MKLFKDYKIQIALFLGLFYLAGLFIMDNWKSTMRNGDSSGYYIHNVSFFINHDVGDYGKTLSSFTDNYPKSAYLLDDPYWIKETKTGKKFIKYSIGVAVMETPAFLLAHLYARLSKQYHSDGFSKPYIFSINLIQIIYIGIGFYFLALVLSKYFPKHIVVWTLLSIGLGTNLFIQATYLTIAHTFLFFNFSCLIYLSDQFYRKPTYLKASLIGLLVGLIALIRVPEIIASLIPLTWGVYNRKTLLNRMHFIKEKFALFFYCCTCYSFSLLSSVVLLALCEW